MPRCWGAEIGVSANALMCFRSRTRSSSKSADTLCHLLMDLWANIFAYLKPDHTVDFFDWDDTDERQRQDVSELITAQAHYHKLKLVCSKFKQVFQEHSELSDEIILAEGNRSHMMPHALVWLRQKGSAIRSFLLQHSVEVPLKIWFWQQWLLRHHILSICT